MDSSDNVTGERSVGSHDEICDPEVEARLYGEIYYSNETWIRDVDEPSAKESTDKEPNVPSVPPEPTSVFDTENVVSRVESQDESVCTSRENIFQNSTSPHQCSLSSQFSRSRYRIDNRPSKGSRDFSERRFESRSANERLAEPLVRQLPSSGESIVVNTKYDSAKQRGGVVNTDGRPEKRRADRVELEIGRRTQNERGKSKKKRDRTRKKKPNMKESQSVFVEIPSDSDDSILEVPVPPRAQPPLIQLVDSDDESGERANAGSRSPIKKSNPAKPSEEPVVRPFDRNVPSAPVAVPARPNSDGIGDETILLNIANPTSSRSSFRQTVPSREEVGIIHGADTTVRANSDDSMTESEATNWTNIAAGQADSAGNTEIFSIEEALLAPCGSFCDRSTFVRASENNPVRPSDRVPPGGTIDAPPNNTDTLFENDGAKSNEPTKRKRRKDGDTSSMEKSNTPRKKNKKNSCQASDDGSLTDYFFKEMSKKLQAFYNDPWGSENLDVQRVQSTMPKNPRYWTILEADLSPVSKRRGKTCSRCGTNAHRGRRCPDKSAEPKCCMCGAKGHLQTRCPQRMCLTCGRKYMTFRPTCDYCSNLYCYMCTGTGHTHEQCPDSWRKYHDTTSETLPGPRDPNNIMKAPKDLSCCNCAKRGHDSTMCKQLRWSQHFPTPMFVTSYTAGPIYPPLYREPPREANRSIECVVIPDENDDRRPVNEALRVQPEQSVTYDNVVFQCGNLNPSNVIDLQSVSKYLGKLDNAHTRGLLDGNLQPTFLNLWLENFVFNVRITSGNDGESILLLVEANSKDVLRGLEKLLMQWFARSDEEKPYLTYDVLPYENIKYLSDELGRKLSQIKKDPSPATLLRKIIALEETLRRTCAKLTRIANGSEATKSARRKSCAIRFNLRAIMSQRCQLVTSLYAGGWVPGSEVTLHSLRKLFDRLKSTKQHIRIDDYMEIVYLYNEIFTFHMSNGLAEALRRATTITGSSTEVVPSGEGLEKQFVAWMDLNALDETIQGDSSGPSNNNLGSGNGQIRTILGNNVGDHSLPERREPAFGIFPNVRTENATIPESFRFTGSNDAFPTSSRATAINEEYIRLEESMRHIDQLDSHRSQVLLINHYNKARKKATKKCDQTLIKNMKKKQRKLHRRSAKAAIKKADSSSATHLKNMAMALKKKLLDNSLRHDDIKLLKNALIFEKQKQRTLKYSKL